MTRPDTGSSQWAMVDEGWGRKAVDFATLSEPGNCREYVAVHHRLGVDAGDRLLDVACGSGFAIELAGLRGAFCSGVDASARLAAVARDRNPECDIRVGDMHALPWERLLESDESVDVERLEVPFAWEFAEAIQNVGEAEFHRAAAEQAQGRLRNGLPLRADINMVGYLARKPEGAERA
jgi:SAM-dependent methyltransferase